MRGPSLVPADVPVSPANRENAYDILVIRWLIFFFVGALLANYSLANCLFLPLTPIRF